MRKIGSHKFPGIDTANYNRLLALITYVIYLLHVIL